MVAVLVGDDGFMADTGEWLVAHRRRLDMSEAEWLAVLGEFHAAGLYELDGQYSTVNWLALRCGMARSTAHEKVKVAAELRRRPWLAAALADGAISYSAIRLICRIDDYNRELDQALIDVAVHGSIDEVERAVRHWQLVHGQDNPPPPERIGYRMSHGFCGLGRATIDAPNDVLDELDVMITAFVRRADQNTPPDVRHWAHRRLDGLMDMGRTALPHAHDGAATGADIYMMQVVVDLERLTGGQGRATLKDGTPIDDATLTRIACDTATVAHLTRDGIEPLALGRKTREWSTAQRRAITVRDGGRCRLPGCVSTHCDIHHLRPWDPDGPTDVDNGYLQCRHDHVLVHRGDIVVDGDPNGTLTFRRRDGTFIGASRPPGNPARLFA